MESILIFILVIVAIALIALVLIQHGKGADVGAAFGSGASSTVFGSQGSTSFLMKLTIGLAVVFFIICIILTNLANRAAKENAIILPQNSASQPANPQQQPAVPNPVPVAPAK